MKTYIIYDSKLKDGLRKINDESITLAGSWDKKQQMLLKEWV